MKIAGFFDEKSVGLLMKTAGVFDEKKPGYSMKTAGFLMKHAGGGR